MSGRPTEAAQRAIAHAMRTGCSPTEAARKHGVSYRTVRRGLAAAGVPARPVGYQRP